MSEVEDGKKPLTLRIPVIKAESETQTTGLLVTRSPDIIVDNEMDALQQTQSMSLRKRRNLSKNRAQAARQREKTPEPGRTPVPHEDTTTSDDEEVQLPRNSREIEADNTYEEMKRLVQEKANVKDPVYDLDRDELIEARAMEANERRRRSISPFALPDKEELENLGRRNSFLDPTNKLLTAYSLSPKDEDIGRRSSLTIEPSLERRDSLSPPTTASPKDKQSPYPFPPTPKKLDEMVYPDENSQRKLDEKPRKPRNESVSSVEEKQNVKAMKTPETPTSGELVTKVIQIERTPSKKISQADVRPNVEVRERIVRTPSRKTSTTEARASVTRQSLAVKDEQQSNVPPVKPARSKSATRLGGKTSESEMSEDQANYLNANVDGNRRRVTPTPRRFTKNRSPRANRSQSVHRVEELKVVDQSGATMSQTSREIIELMQQARARSLSVPKDDPKVLPEYRNHNKNLRTPNKTPSSSSRRSRGISCPKTIQIISDKEILSGIPIPAKTEVERIKRNRRSSGHTDISLSEYTSSCYSTSPSENEYDFDLSERTAELTRKLNLLSQEVVKREDENSVVLPRDDMSKKYEVEPKSVVRKRSIADKNGVKNGKEIIVRRKSEVEPIKEKSKSPAKSRWGLIANWQQFKVERRVDYENLKMLRNRCICDFILLIMMCGLGGMMFKTLEGSFENAYKCSSRNVKRDFIENLWRGSHYLREEDWKSMARKKLYEFEEQLHTAHEAGVTSYSGQRSWNFMNSFVYCMTLVTTIGYGHIAPKTTYGRVATIVYAIVGIPLFLIVLADFGKLFTRIIKYFWAFIRRFYYTRSCRKVRRTVPMQEMMKGFNIVCEVVRRPSQMFSEEDLDISPIGDKEKPPTLERKPSDVPPPLPPKPGSMKDPENETEPETPAPSLFEIDDEFNLPISVAIFILVVYLIIGAVGYNMWEKWTFFESFYFVFISMSTIGLGDLVPDHPMFMMASILYLVFGLALTSMCINVVQVKLSNTFKKASAKLGATIGLKVAEEDGSLVTSTPPAIEIPAIHRPKETEESKKKDGDGKKS